MREEVSRIRVDGVSGELQEWWLTEFSDQERKYVFATYNPMGLRGPSGDSDLVGGLFCVNDRSSVSVLSTLAGWFSKPHDRTIARRLLSKASGLVGPHTPVLDQHFLLHQIIKTYYPDREVSGFLEVVVSACRTQIDLAPQAAAAFKMQLQLTELPSHTGYMQLAIVLEKRGEYAEVIALCGQAASQGWKGDWDKRGARCTRKAQQR